MVEKQQQSKNFTAQNFTMHYSLTRIGYYEHEFERIYCDLGSVVAADCSTHWPYQIMIKVPPYHCFSYSVQVCFDTKIDTRCPKNS